ncbi:HupE/UreJ family protein [Flavobacterium sp. DG1-102-2]|uniref:HupE/UreJ family protein n=1 Tax=Flavobacterium sp. DG1-102-2 TaxID=3081663 RepID=UPI002948D34A|nr:HupE/UreJ family protein [Flavobacterium sp. DG1-102-2]MDV6169294.1 HupE/UreJ family protein [Flavobacterium sp. DG1-102-2]
MSEFLLYFETGLRHVLDINGYDHLLFITMLTVPYTFKDWKNILALITLFTVGHTISLILSVYGVIKVNPSMIEFLIPVTILIAAIYNIIKLGKKSSKNNSISAIAITALFFGIIHGLGFSNYFKLILDKNTKDKMLPLLEFALGIETAQLIIVLMVLIIGYVLIEFFRLGKRDWVLITSAFVAGVVVPMIIGSEIW